MKFPDVIIHYCYASGPYTILIGDFKNKIIVTATLAKVIKHYNLVRPSRSIAINQKHFTKVDNAFFSEQYGTFKISRRRLKKFI